MSDKLKELIDKAQTRSDLLKGIQYWVLAKNKTLTGVLFKRLLTEKPLEELTQEDLDPMTVKNEDPRKWG